MRLPPSWRLRTNIGEFLMSKFAVVARSIAAKVNKQLGKNTIRYCPDSSSVSLRTTHGGVEIDIVFVAKTSPSVAYSYRLRIKGLGKHADSSATLAGRVWIEEPTATISIHSTREIVVTDIQLPGISLIATNKDLRALSVTIAPQLQMIIRANEL